MVSWVCNHLTDNGRYRDPGLFCRNSRFLTPTSTITSAAVLFKVPITSTAWSIVS
ncbi:hypothetical protein MAMMFC1_00108 [Methylomusa anaerophila]|uniref:Uncharacterized protein n=1 Tax=Methylomusa anaerophila TaxID=1930071 RepID=A0A348AEH7_9FIRM|nr:hypothetical protein MAMMFC1_00108 [Methylomusa anaerophila]